MDDVGGGEGHACMCVGRCRSGGWLTNMIHIYLDIALKKKKKTPHDKSSMAYVDH